MSGTKKGIPTLAIVGGGCLVVVIVGVIGIAILLKKGTDYVKDVAQNPAKIAELAVKSDPNLEFIGSDDSRGTITFRDKRTGKDTTIDWEQIKDGKITVKSGDETTTLNAKDGQAVVETAEGTSTFGVGGIEKMPKWFEMPGGVANWKSANHTEKADGQLAGMVIGESSLTVQEVAASFEEKIAAAGFERKSKTEASGRVIAVFEDAEKKRALTVSIFPQGQNTGVSVGYQQRESSIAIPHE